MYIPVFSGAPCPAVGMNINGYTCKMYTSHKTRKTRDTSMNRDRLMWHVTRPNDLRHAHATCDTPKQIATHSSCDARHTTRSNELRQSHVTCDTPIQIASRLRDIRHSQNTRYFANDDEHTFSHTTNSDTPLRHVIISSKIYHSHTAYSAQQPQRVTRTELICVLVHPTHVTHTHTRVTRARQHVPHITEWHYSHTWSWHTYTHCALTPNEHVTPVCVTRACTNMCDTSTHMWRTH